MDSTHARWYHRRPQRVRALYLEGPTIINTIDGGRERVEGQHYLVWDREAPYGAFPSVVAKEDFERSYDVAGDGEAVATPVPDHSHGSGTT